MPFFRWGKYFVIFSLVAFSFSGWGAPVKSSGTYYAFRLGPGEDLLNGILQFTEANKLKAASIVTVVGSLKTARIRFADQKDSTSLQGPFEITSVTGTIAAAGEKHLHIALADSKGSAVGGHLVEGCRVYTTAEIVLVNLDEVKFSREVDPKTGFKELVVEGAKK